MEGMLERYTRKTIDCFDVQGDYGQGWETVTSSNSRKEARQDLKAYRENEPYAFRIKRTLEKITPSKTYYISWSGFKMSDEPKMIDVTPKFFSDLKKAYQKALEEKKESFSFEGNEYLVTYAKYMIEYLEGEAKRRKWPKE